MKKLSIISFLLTALSSSITMAQTNKIEGFGVFKPISNPSFKTDTSYKVVFDVYTTHSDSKKLNRGIDTIARFINMHLNAGLEKKDLDISLVIHGAAGKDVLLDKEYKKKFASNNPNLNLIKKLNDFGVNIIICGQTLAFNEYQASHIIDGINISLSAMSALLKLQKEGYGLINFN